MPDLYGFKTSKRSVHSARSMMGKELDLLLEGTSDGCSISDYKSAITERNILSKGTANNREITFQMLRTLYTLDPGKALFRALRRLRTRDNVVDHLLYFQLAFARDPLLRSATRLVLDLDRGTKFEKGPVEDVVRSFPGSSYSEVSVASFTRNMGSSWTQAGFLEGRHDKHRSQPALGSANAIFAALCAILDGWQGEVLFDSPWLRLLDRSRPETELLFETAARLGQMRLLKAGGVFEFRFPGYLTTEEEAFLHG